MTEEPTVNESAAPSLRSLLTGVSDVPPFRMLLAAGWEQHEVNADSGERLARRASEKIRMAGRPDLDAQIGIELRRSFAAMEKVGSKYVYLPVSEPDQAVVPMSIVASMVRGASGGSLDSAVAQLFSSKGAEFFDSLKSTVRWEQKNVGTGEVDGTTSHRVNYVIAVPQTARRQAVLFTATIFYPTTDPIDDDTLEACIGLSDAMLSTFAWIKQDSAGDAES